jgi:ABC-type uncharacterized transport system substrate-binding protein
MRKPERSSFLVVFALVLLTSGQAQTHRILQVNSYGSDWIWIQEQRFGFQQGLGESDVDFRVIDLDAKNKDAAGVRAMVEEAVKTIEEWKPDLLFTTDDLVQSEVAARYLGSPLPIVYSGVNREPAQYGFTGAANVTGVLEREHFAATLALLLNIIPQKKPRLAIIIDDDPTWIGVVQRIKDSLKKDDAAEVVYWLQPKTFQEFKTEMTRLQDQVDAVGMIGVFRFSDEKGGFTDYETVLRWTAENSKLPDFSFWDTRVERGTLCAVTVSGIEQGRLAGAMARRILVDHVPPSSIPAVQSAKGLPMISLARARKLGIAIDSGLLLSSRVLSKFIWER